MTTTPTSMDSVWAEYLTDDAIDRTSRLILEPTTYRQRTIETAEVIDDVLTRRIRLELASGPGAHLVPIASPKRDTLIDLVSVTATDAVVGIIPIRYHADVFAKRLLERQLSRLSLDPREPAIEFATSIASVPPRESIHLRHLLDTLASVNSGSQGEAAALAVNPALLILAQDDVFMKLFRWLRGTAPLLVPCMPKTVAFALDFEVQSGMSHVDTRSFPRAVRSMLGLTVLDFEFPARSALFTQSYHFQYRAPVGHYVQDCSVLGSIVAVQRQRRRIKGYAKRTYSPTTPSFAMFANADVDGLAHVHVSNARMDPSRPRSLTIGIKVSERPLGQMFAALTRWAVVLSMIVTIRNLGQRLVIAQGTFATTLLLAVPGLVGISSLLLSPVEPAHTRPIGPRVLSFLAGIVSLISSIVFIQWSLDYSDCTRNVVSSSAPVRNQLCASVAPNAIYQAFNAMELLGGMIVVLLATLFGINVSRYLRAERARPVRYSLAARA